MSSKTISKASKTSCSRLLEQMDAEKDNLPSAMETNGAYQRDITVEAMSKTAQPFMGVKTRRLASIKQDTKGDYLDVFADPFLSSMIYKRGDRSLLFADKILKCSSSGKMKRRLLLITNAALYLVDPSANVLKRRIALATIDRICLSKLKDNFFAIDVPSEYDCLLASTRKTEIVNVLVEASKIRPELEIGVVFSNRFAYRPAADKVKEIGFEQLEEGIKTVIADKIGR